MGQNPKTISSYYVEESLIKGIRAAFVYLTENKVEGDVLALVSMLGLQGLQLHQGEHAYRTMPYAVDRNHLLFKAVRMELERGFVPYRKSICDQFWQLFEQKARPILILMGAS